MLTKADLFQTATSLSKALAAKSRYLTPKTFEKCLIGAFSGPGDPFKRFLNNVPARYFRSKPGQALWKLRAVWRTSYTTLYAHAMLSKKPLLLRFTTAKDDRVRHNHAAGHGFIASPNHWCFNLRNPDNVIPALGFNCRCHLEPLTPAEANRLIAQHGLKFFMGRKLPAGFHRDEGFGTF